MQLAVAITTLAVGLAIALLTYQKNPRSGTNIYFAFLVFFVGIYPVFNYLALHAPSDEVALYWAKAILVVSIPQGPLLYFFARTFPNTDFVFRKRLQLAIAVWVALNLVLAVTGMIFRNVTVNNGTVSIQPGPLVPSFGILHALTILGGLTTLFTKYRHAQGRSKQQLALISYGITISFSLTFLITFILPLVLKSTLLLAVSPLFLAVSLAVAAYAIIAQRLFSIQAAVARSAAYTLALVTMTLLYIIGVFAISSIFLNSHVLDARTEAIYTLLALVLAFSFHSVKVRFDRLTTRLFYQDAYDPQVLLNKLNRILATDIHLDQLLSKTMSLIARELKTDFCVTVLLTPHSQIPRVVGTVQKEFPREDVMLAHSTALRRKNRDSPIVADFLDTKDDSALKELLDKNGIAILARIGKGEKQLGHILLGPKKSGNLYNKQDIRIIETIADELVIAIENALHFEEIQNFNATLQRQVSEATKRLRQTNTRLRQLDETKDDFISMASHQLRTPLTSVKGYLSMVLEGDVGGLNKQQRKMLTQSYASAQRMVYLISDLLNLSRLNTGKFVIEPTAVDLRDVVQSELDQVRETAASREVKLAYERPATFPALMLDETKIHQVVMNFIDNAIYYTPAGGTITVSLRETPSAVEYTVVDNGIGVPKSEQHKLFTKFYRAQNAQRARPDGTGLGLFMAKKVIAAQGGSIIFQSEQGKGSTFGFRFTKLHHVVPPAFQRPKA